MFFRHAKKLVFSAGTDIRIGPSTISGVANNIAIVHRQAQREDHEHRQQHRQQHAR